MFGRPGWRQRVGAPRLNKAEMTLMAWGMVATPWISMSSYGSCACSERKNSWETRVWFQLIGTWVLACSMQHVEVFVSGCHLQVWTQFEVISKIFQAIKQDLCLCTRNPFLNLQLHHHLSDVICSLPSFICACRRWQVRLAPRCKDSLRCTSRCCRHRWSSLSIQWLPMSCYRNTYDKVLLRMIHGEIATFKKSMLLYCGILFDDFLQ